MASASGSRSGKGKKNTNTSSRTRSTSNSRTAAKSSTRVRTEEESAITNEIILIGVFALSVLLFLCNFGVIGPVGNAVSSFMFGIFGMIAYIVPVLVFVGLAFGISNRGNFFASMKIGASVLMVLLAGVVIELISGPVTDMDTYAITKFYQFSSGSKLGGGVLSGSLAYLMDHFLGTVGAVVLVLVLGIICVVIITEKSFVGGVKKQSRKVYETARADAQIRKERAAERAKQRQEEEILRQQKEEAILKERQLRMDKKVSGVMADTSLQPEKKETPKPSIVDFNRIRVHMAGKEVTDTVPAAKNNIVSVQIKEKKEQPAFAWNEKIKQKETEEQQAGMKERHESVPLRKEVKDTDSANAENVDMLAETYRDADVFRDMRVITPNRKVITAKPMKEMVFKNFHQEEIPWDTVAPERYSAAVGTVQNAVKESEDDNISVGGMFAAEYFIEEPEEIIEEPEDIGGESEDIGKEEEGIGEEVPEESDPDEYEPEEEDVFIPGVRMNEQEAQEEKISEKILFREMDFSEENFSQETLFDEEEIIPVRERPKAVLPKQGHSSEPVLDKNGRIVPETQQKRNGTVQKPVETKAPVQPLKKNVKQRPYQYPPITLLEKIENGDRSDAVKELKNTAEKLQQILEIFGVKVTITDISQGPAITRYELQPEMGVKVSKILSLSDDIKMHLAATDIRIEAPIPGKAAIGIEVPNKESSMVGLRELLESREFKEASSKITFAVGKDIAGKVVVHDIAKMPHMLVAGSTGSGKSVCINTLIMSILYKAKPDEVKLILIDPKVVELSVYNGIPHLLIPVVTDPKQASSALQWAVAEMTDRYQKFADFNVRDLKGFNKKAAEMRERGDEGAPDKLPQIVIIVDELADLMMVAPGEVEEYICRLAQLARACGIHLVIATQRPSVDVITGLIKNNMSSRIAFAVTSGVDSRTILDMNGAEKLLGKGDMLFAPMGYPKPARLQGAFVSDNEVANVVDYLKNQVIGNVYDEQILDKVKHMSSGGSGSGSSDAEERDPYFEKVARFIIEKDKASIGMLQRAFKIGFNRAARIMDQLADAGVVGEEEGTKPRKILMSEEQFEQYVEDYL